VASGSHANTQTQTHIVNMMGTSRASESLVRHDELVIVGVVVVLVVVE